MARIDALLNRMRTNATSRVYFQADSPSLWQLPTGTVQGNSISAADLETTIREVAPPSAMAALKAKGSATFMYGGFSFIVEKQGESLILDIAVPEPEPVLPPPAPATPPPTPSTNPYAPANPYGPPGTGMPFNNSSGQGAMADVPPEAQRWNWGAFFLPWIWAIGNSAWIGLLALIPGVGFVMRFVLGAKGSEWSWRNRRWNSVADFQNAQRTWGIVGAALVVGGGLFAVPVTSAIMFPVFARARENAKRAVCQQHLLHIGLGVMEFSQDHSNKLPVGNMSQWQSQLSKYVISPPLFHCPADTTGQGLSYQVNPKLSGVSLDSLANPALTPMIWDNDTTEHLGGRNVLFADGHIRWYKDYEWQTQFQPLTQ